MVCRPMDVVSIIRAGEREHTHTHTLTINQSLPLNVLLSLVIYLVTSSPLGGALCRSGLDHGTYQILHWPTGDVSDLLDAPGSESSSVPGPPPYNGAEHVVST